MDEEEKESFKSKLKEMPTEEIKLNLSNLVYGKSWKLMLAEAEIESRAYLRGQREVLHGRVSEARGNLIRLLILGNAGGTIASLSFIGTLISGSEKLTYNPEAFPILAIFVLGLASGWLIRLLDFGIALNYYSSLIPNNNAQGVPAPNWLKNLSIAVCFGSLVIGSIKGLGLLWGLTSP